MSRGSDAGQQMADAILEWLNLMYQRQTRQRVLDALIEGLSQAAREGTARNAEEGR